MMSYESAKSIKSTASIASPPPEISVVLPVYNEAGNLVELHRRLTLVLPTLVPSYELVFVDDGSQDASFPILQQLHDQDSHVRVLRFSRNFGHHVAVTAGMEYAEGNTVLLMDSDLQDLPEEIPKLWHTLQAGYDMVYGIRQNKKFPWTKRCLSWAFRWTMRHLLGYRISGGIFRILRRRVVNAVLRCQESDRMIVGLIQWVGFRQIGTPVEHGTRHTGSSHYSLRKQWQLASQAMTAFSPWPLQLAFWFGWLALLLGTVGMVWWLFSSPAPSVLGWQVVMCVVFLMGGLQFLCIGIVGTYLARIFTASRQRPLYIVDTWLSQPTSPAAPFLHKI